MPRRCQAHNAAGNPCSAHVYEGEEYCRWHNPDRASERKQWAVKGGKNRSNLSRLKRLWSDEKLDAGEVTGLLSAALVATYEGTLDPGVLTALASGARALVAVQQAGELEDRLEALERRAGIGGVA